MWTMYCFVASTSTHVDRDGDLSHGWVGGWVGGWGDISYMVYGVSTTCDSLFFFTLHFQLSPVSDN